MPAKKKFRKTSKDVLSKYYVYALYGSMILLTLLNINSYLGVKQKTVLGIETVNSEGIFWYDFLQKNPNYIPGWVEIDRQDKVDMINPNYF